MKYEQEHIKVYYSNKELVLEVDDRELLDFIEDYLVQQCDIIPEYYRDKDNGSYLCYFDEKIDFDLITSKVKSLDKNEINRIYKLNN